MEKIKAKIKSKKGGGEYILILKATDDEIQILTEGDQLVGTLSIENRELSFTIVDSRPTDTQLALWRKKYNQPLP